MILMSTSVDDVNIRLWDINTIQCFLPFVGNKDTLHTARITCIQYGPHGQLFGNSIAIHDMRIID